MSTVSVVVRPFALVAAVGTALALGACDTRSPSAQAVTDASTKVSMAGLNSASAEEGTKGLQAAVQGVKGLQGTPAEQASASLLVAQAAMSEGEASAMDASRFDRELRIGLSDLVALGNQWARSNSQAAAASAFDPAKQIAELSAQASEKDRQVALLAKERQETEARIAELRNAAKSISDEAQNLHRQAAELAQQAGNVSAREGVGIVEQSAALRRQGDAKAMNAEQITSQADQIAPRVTELETLSRQYGNQKTNILKTQEDLRKTQTDKRQEADAARAAANTSAQALKTQMDALLARHAGEYTASFDKAVSAYKQAAGESRKAGNAAGAKLSLGSAELALAGLHQRHAQLAESVASTFDHLASVKPSLPAVSDISSKAKSLRDGRATSMEEAKTSLDNAKNAFQSAQSQVKGAEKERLEQLVTMLDKLSAGGSVEAPAAAPEEGGSPSAAAPATADIPEGAKALVAASIDAMKEGRWDDVKAMYVVNTDAGKQMLDASFRAVSAGTRLDKAFQSKYQTSFADALKKAPGGEMVGPMMAQMSKGDMSGVDLSTVTYTKNEKGVKVEMGGVGMPLQAFEKDGAWKFDGSQIDAMAPAMAMQMQALSGILDVQDTFAGRVEKGEFPDATAAAVAFMQAMQGAMMGGGGGG